MIIGINIFNGCTQLSRLYVASSSIRSLPNFYSTISSSYLGTNRVTSCISFTHTTTPTQYAYNGLVWPLCYESSQPTPSPTYVTGTPTPLPTVAPTYTPGNPTPVPTLAPTGMLILLLLTLLLLLLLHNCHYFYYH